EAYAGCWHSGYAIIDLADIAHPRTLAHVQLEPEPPEPAHTFLKVPFQIGGRDIAVSTDEERKHRGPDIGKPHAPLRVWDVTDRPAPRVIAEHQVPENASPYHGTQVRFGAHQLRERV